MVSGVMRNQRIKLNDPYIPLRMEFHFTATIRCPDHNKYSIDNIMKMFGNSFSYSEAIKVDSPLGHRAVGSTLNSTCHLVEIEGNKSMAFE